MEPVEVAAVQLINAHFKCPQIVDFKTLNFMLHEFTLITFFQNNISDYFHNVFLKLIFANNDMLKV